MMLALATALLIQGASTSAFPTDSAGNRADWLERPSARSLVECVHKRMPAFRIVLACRTAPNDRLTDCAPAPDQPPASEELTTFAVCLAKFYRIRATGADGKPVTGTIVLVPLTV